VAQRVEEGLNDGHLVRYFLDPILYPIKSKHPPAPLTKLQIVEAENETNLRELRKKFSSIKLKNVGSLRERAKVFGFDAYGLKLVEDYFSLLKDLGFDCDGSGGISIHLNYRQALDKVNELESIAYNLKRRLAKGSNQMYYFMKEKGRIVRKSYFHGFHARDTHN
jgi:hypothetical protein